MSRKGSTMELLDRYLQAVSKHLPGARRQDLLAELRANLEAQLEDRQEALGRGLTEGEAGDWLREMGAPWQVAARYLPQQSLIGPMIFPVYWYALRMALLWALVIYTVVSALLVALGTQGAGAVAGAVLRAPDVLFMVAAWVTLVFAGIEFFALRFPGSCDEVLRKMMEWSPASLPPVEKSRRGRAPRSFAHAMAEFVFGVLFLVWLVLVPFYPFLLLGPGVVYLHASPFEITHAVAVFFYWVVGLNVFQVAWRGVDLARGSWQRPRRMQQLLFEAYGLIPMVVLLTAPGHAVVRLKHPAVDGAHYAGTVSQINAGVHQGLLVLMVIVVLQFAWNLWQWAREMRADG